jgi:heptosyltransferase-1
MPSILFVKTSSLGDVVHNCPAASDVARRFPGAEIDWVVEESFAGIAALHPQVRKVIPVAVRRWRRALLQPQAWREMRALRDTLADRRYDFVIDTQSLLKSALITSFSRGPRHGMDRASAREPLAARFYDVVHRVPRGRHAVERNRDLTAQALGYSLDGATVDYGFRLNAGDRQEGPVVLLTMTSRADKLWPVECWVELGRRLGTRLELPWGSEAERERAAGIASSLPQAHVPERLGFEALARLFVGARAVIGLDTGLTHFAAALGVPTAGIYCGSDPALTGLYGLSHAKNIGTLGRPPSVDEVLQAL